MRSGSALGCGCCFFLGLFALWTDLPPVSGQFTDFCHSLPSVSEGCGEPKHRFFYNITSKKCMPFLFRGCSQNMNQFRTIEECQRYCEKIEKPGFCPPSPTKSASPTAFTECHTNCIHDGTCLNDQKCCSYGCSLRCSDPVKDLCQLPSEKGPCHIKVQKWYYDWQTQTCKRFVYGGCLGNKNNFKNRKECQAKCIQQSKWEAGRLSTPQQTSPAPIQPRT